MTGGKRFWQSGGMRVRVMRFNTPRGTPVSTQSNSPPEPRRPTEAARLEIARLPTATPLVEVFERATRLAAHTLQVARVGVWLFVDDRTALRCACLYERSTGEHSSGAVLRVADFPAYFAALAIRKAIPAEVAASDTRTAELDAGYLRPLGISSMLDAGIFAGDDLAGVVCLEHVGQPREWTTEDRDFAGSMADLLAVRLQSAEAGEWGAAVNARADRLTELDKAASVQQMTAGLAHDFRNLLTVIVGNADRLTRRPELTDESKALAAAVLTAAERGVELTQSLLDFARPTHQPPAVLDLADATADFLPVLRAAVGRGQLVRFERPPQAGQVLIDRGEYARVLLNLVLNARDAMPGGGEVTVRVAPVRRAGDPGRYVMLEVSDRGAGMDDATRGRVWEPFFTTKPQGTGLGLAVVRRVMDRVGGAVQIESEVGRGTTVRAYFPRVGTSTGGTVEMPALRG
jgi:two-component system cell cycle sensor histidine kinase/response regulator CckA